jgi:hypothetical protein
MLFSAVAMSEMSFAWWCYVSEVTEKGSRWW